MGAVTSAADKIKANAARFGAANRAAAGAETAVAAAPAAGGDTAGTAASTASAAVPAVPAVVRQRNVRRTVDLSPAAHRGLDNWQRDAADRLGLARVTGQDVLAALVDRLLADAALSEAIVAAIAAQRS